MSRFRPEKDPRPVPDNPRERALNVKERVAKQRSSGRFTEDDRIRDEQIAEHRRRLEQQIAADDRPISERVPEYVLDYDDSGNVIGIKPAR